MSEQMEHMAQRCAAELEQVKADSAQEIATLHSEVEELKENHANEMAMLTASHERTIQQLNMEHVQKVRYIVYRVMLISMFQITTRVSSQNV